MPTWPESLPNCFMIGGGFGLNPRSNTLAIDPEVGEPLTRERFTGDLSDLTGTLAHLTTGQAQDLLDFWKNDLHSGAMRFTWDHPLTRESVEMLFMSPPSFDRISGSRWNASLTLRIIA